MVTLAASVIETYERFSLYNSPYPAHDRGCAVDLYPGCDDARSPVAGDVIETRTVRCPPKSYATDEDHLILVDCGDVVARILHVDPGVEAGDTVAIGDSLGTLVRSGFFGQWVDNHIHLGFRKPEQNLWRASGSLPLELDVAVTGVPWSGVGTVIGVGSTHVQLDTPSHEGRGFAAISSDSGVPLDGGLTHYTGGGALESTEGELSLLGGVVGTAAGRDVRWHDVALVVRRRGSSTETRATGLSLFTSQVELGAKLVFHEGHDFSVGDRLEVAVVPTDEPIRLG